MTPRNRDWVKQYDCSSPFRPTLCPKAPNGLAHIYVCDDSIPLIDFCFNFLEILPNTLRSLIITITNPSTALDQPLPPRSPLGVKSGEDRVEVVLSTDLWVRK
jgi:hypothetical protein